VERGFEIPDDALNIALHEFAHCIMIENISGPVPGLFFNRKEWNQLMQIGRDKMNSINKGEIITLRKYGGTNTMEFFAVSIENFFERPEHCRDNLPQLYSHLCLLLNQDPIIASDPVIKKSTHWLRLFGS
jgi:MtfA peptidase